MLRTISLFLKAHIQFSNYFTPSEAPQWNPDESPVWGHNATLTPLGLLLKTTCPESTPSVSPSDQGYQFITGDSGKQATLLSNKEGAAFRITFKKAAVVTTEYL